MMRALIACAVAAALFTPALARDLGQWTQVSPQQRQWFREQLSPKTRQSCCSEADGVHAEEDIRYDAKGVGHYWARFVVFPNSPHEKQIDWMQVPDDVVLPQGNPNGSPVVWFYWESGVVKIRCYAPGGGA